MDTILRKPTSIRLQQDLLEKLKEQAKASNRSLNNFIECILIDAVAKYPNKETIEAMREVAENKTLVGYNNIESLMQALNEE